MLNELYVLRIKLSRCCYNNCDNYSSISTYYNIIQCIIWLPSWWYNILFWTRIFI